MRSPLSTSRALASVLLIFSGFAATPAFAQKTSFVDVPAGSYYEDAAAALLQSGALDQTARLRPAELATRAELVQLLVNVQNTPLLYPSVSSFNDVLRSSWYFPFFEAASNQGWVRGSNNCYEQSRPCNANPTDHVNRAEAASLLVRSFTLDRNDSAPVFTDNPQNQWYFNNIQTAADHCVLQGDDITRKVRPAAFMNRAEMITMFYRASVNLHYGTDCGQQAAYITSVSAVSATRVRLTFDRALSESRAEDSDRYSISRPTTVQLATLIDSKTVELSLASQLVAGDSYIVTVRDLLALDGTVFSDNKNFSFSEFSGHISESAAVSGRHIQLTFDTPLDTNRAIDTSRYTVTAVVGGATIGVQSVTVLSSSKIDLTLSQNMTTDASYDVTARNLLTQDNVLFTDSVRVTLTVSAGHITDATALSVRRVRLAFDTNLDTGRAADAARYTMTRASGAGEINVQSVTILNNRTIELLLDADISINVPYVVTATHLLTQAGTDFTESADVMLSAELTGHVTTATAVAANRVDVTFDVDLDPSHAEEPTRYILSDSVHTISIASAQLLTNRKVQLSLGETMQAQRAYTLEVRGMQGTTGVIFSDTFSFVYDAATVNFHANLTGGQEVPSIITTATGTGTFLLQNDGLHYDIVVQNLSSAMTAAHFHQALAGQSGPAVFTISFSGNHAVGVWSNITNEQRSALFDGGIYTNVHTTTNANGEIRGQLLR